MIYVSRDWGFGRQIRRLKTLDFRGGAGGGEGPRLRIAIIPDIWQFCERCVFWLAARNEIDDKSFRDFNIGLSRNLYRDNRIEKPSGDPHERNVNIKTKNSLISKRSKGEGKGIWTFPSLPF